MLELAMAAPVVNDEPAVAAEQPKEVVVGWSARAASYFWLRPFMDLCATNEVLSPRFEEAGVLSRQLAADDGWTDEERRRPTVLAWQTLAWGGVTRQEDFGAPVVEWVFRRALGVPGGDDAPMNSGWTKVAALATAYLEEEPGRAPHVIREPREHVAGRPARAGPRGPWVRAEGGAAGNGSGGEPERLGHGLGVRPPGHPAHPRRATARCGGRRTRCGSAAGRA
jgi:hypothetical protein